MMQNQLIQNILHLFLLKNGRWGLPEGLTLIFALVWFFVELFILAVVLYLAGLIVVGKKRALLSDAFIISLLGTVLSTLFTIFHTLRLNRVAPRRLSLAYLNQTLV
ncbi:MAG: hypothetical protein QHH12_05165 [Candidatus Bathyarchaeota archaeon]|nr:hypothetical protein [Candidatus Bathyarchaeota archaeon]